MPLLRFVGVGISGLSAAVPTTCYNNLLPGSGFTETEAAAVVELTGIRRRRVASPAICASDLCHAAADRLLDEMTIDRATIDVLIFVSQTPDYRMPATAILLQDRLGLSRDTAAYDVNLGCSGFVYGLSMAYAYCHQPSVHRVLLLNGETRTRAYSFRDKATGLLFGDGGTATLVERLEHCGESAFSLRSDGSRGGYIIIKSGGYRHPSTPASLVEKTYPDGSVRTDEQGTMDGPGILEFAIDEVPKEVRFLLNETGMTIESFDVFLFHQANRLLNEYFRKKLKIPSTKMPYSLQNFGNTSSVSIPLTMVTELTEMLRHGAHKLLLCGFGVGLSWASAAITTRDVHMSELIQVADAVP
jgi:3-oxoacyl-[acyl-carrier-protein] synthase III